MRKLLLTIVSFLILNSLFITHAMAVAQCQYIKDRVGIYSKEYWQSILIEFDQDIRQYFYEKTWKHWLKGDYLISRHKEVEILYNKSRNIAKRMGIYNLYKRDSLKAFRQEVMNSNLISDVNGKKSFAEYLGVNSTTLNQWVKGENEISYNGELRLNLLQEYFDKLKAEAASGGSLVPNSSATSARIDGFVETPDIPGPSQIGIPATSPTLGNIIDNYLNYEQEAKRARYEGGAGFDP